MRLSRIQRIGIYLNALDDVLFGMGLDYTKEFKMLPELLLFYPSRDENIYATKDDQINMLLFCYYMALNLPIRTRKKRNRRRVNY